MDRRQFLVGLVALVTATAIPKLADKGTELVAKASANEFPVYYDVGKYYDNGVPTDDMHGARKCPRARVKSKAFGYEDIEWYDHYFDNPCYNYALQQIFRELDGQKITIHSPEQEGETVVFDFNEFHEFNKKYRNIGKSVTLWYSGFMSFGDKRTFESIIIPIPSEVIDSIEKLYK